MAKENPHGTRDCSRNGVTVNPTKSRRPPLPRKDAAKLTRQLNVRLPDKQYAALVVAARKAGVKHSSIIRGLVEKFLAEPS